MALKITWTDNNAGEQGHRIYISDQPLDPDNLPTPHGEVGSDVTEYMALDVDDEAEWHIAVSAYRGSSEAVSEPLHYVPAAGAFMEVFLESGTFTVPAGVTAVDVLMVAGGGGGGGKRTGNLVPAGGGGAGGLRILTAIPVAPSETVSVVVGDGGSGGVGDMSYATNGGNSSFGVFVAEGGGAGRCLSLNPSQNGQDGGSGGGSSSVTSGTNGAGIPGQGNDGGLFTENTGRALAGGGGGVTQAGHDGAQDSGGMGGNGVDLESIGWAASVAEGAPSSLGGGGGGGRRNGVGSGGTLAGADGGVGGGGKGGDASPAVSGHGVSAAANTGGGGGGAGGNNLATGNASNGGDGAKGIVIVRWPSLPTLFSPAGVTTE